MCVPANDDIGVGGGEDRDERILGGEGGDYLLVTVRRRVTEEHSSEAVDLDDGGGGQGAEERPMRRRQTAGSPAVASRPDVLVRLDETDRVVVAVGEFTIGVAAQKADTVADSEQTIDRLFGLSALEYGRVTVGWLGERRFR